MTADTNDSADIALPARLKGDGYVQFGCGTCAPQSWRNFDAGPAFWLQKNFPFLKSALVKRGFPAYPRNIEFGDVIKGLPIAPGSAKAVYSSHVLEHMALEEFRLAIRNVYRYLRAGGVFRMVLPDLEYLARAYLGDSRVNAASHFMHDSCLGEEKLVRGLRGLPRMLFGRSKHFWMWDYKAISPELADAGFVKIRRARIGDSPDARFRDVEEIDPGRWQNCLGVQCEKPE
jgi:predicted SAM-dependent methyltransferase